MNCQRIENVVKISQLAIVPAIVVKVIYMWNQMNENGRIVSINYIFADEEVITILILLFLIFLVFDH